MTTPIQRNLTSPLAAQDTTKSSSTATAVTSDPASEQTFLKLLVAQLKNQDPLNPTDSVQFVTQLAQFSQLEQSLGMKQDLDAIKAALTAVAPATIPAK